MPHPTPLALSTADRTLVDALADAFQAYAPADTSAIARQRALVAMDAIDGHMGGDWLVVRVDAEAKTRQAIFDDLTRYHDDEREYRGHLVTVVSDGTEGPFLSVDGWVISPRRKVVDLRDTLGMIRDLDLLIDVLNETAATR
jgi:hypothetical protein